MAIELVLDASVSLAWFLEGTLKLPVATLDDGHRAAARLHGVTLFAPA